MSEKNIILLNGEWEVNGESPSGEKLALLGSVPGCALNDILNSGIEKEYNDIFYRDNAEKFQKYEDYSWHYKKSFVLEEIGDNVELVFERLDTYCDIYLNGTHISYCDNGNIEHIFEVSKVLCIGENILEVYFYSPIQMNRGRRERRFCAFSENRLYTRRMQCTYGWDWTMRFVTCGMGNAYLRILDKGIKAESVYVYTISVDKYSAAIGVDLTLADYQEGGIIDVEIYDQNNFLICKKSKYCEEKLHKFRINIKEPKLWNPNGYGEQNLHTVVVKCGDRTLYKTLFGIRTVKILELDDAEGTENYEKCLKLKNNKLFAKSNKGDCFSSFTVIINGKRVNCKGGNWVPCQPFNNGNTDKKVTYLLELFAEAGVNMIRIWGGGAFETEHFYNECSRLGIMVSQDFLMACGDYPEEQKSFIEQLRREAEYVTMLARNKPCLIWWTGDNENGTWGTDVRSWFHGRNSAQKGVAPVIYKNDPYRDFFPSSPYGGVEYSSNTAGITHNTYFLSTLFDFIESGNMSEYKEWLKNYTARFSAEDPTLGASSLPTLKRFMTEEDIFGENSEMWLYHTKNNPAMEKELYYYADLFAKRLFGDFIDGADRLFKYKYLQYEWMRVSLENVRREKEFCSGVLYWMLNDCWPAAFGWSLVDYYGIPKASYYSFKRAAKTLVVSVDYESPYYKIWVSNDGEERNIKIRWHAISKCGATVYTSEYINVCSENDLAFVALNINEEDVPENCFIVAELEGEGYSFYRKGVLGISECMDKVEVLHCGDGIVKIKANTYVHVVEIEGEAVFEDNYFSMLEGEVREIKYEPVVESDITVNAYTFSD